MSLTGSWTGAGFATSMRVAAGAGGGAGSDCFAETDVDVDSSAGKTIEGVDDSLACSHAAIVERTRAN